MHFIQTNKPGAIRDTTSKAIHFVDETARSEFAEKQRIQSEINTLKKCVEDLQGKVSNDISEIKNLLLAVITKDNI
jgi:hypothetical protein